MEGTSSTSLTFAATAVGAGDMRGKWIMNGALEQRPKAMLIGLCPLDCDRVGRGFP